jgi:hypothetical protein
MPQDWLRCFKDLSGVYSDVAADCEEFITTPGEDEMVAVANLAAMLHITPADVFARVPAEYAGRLDL